MAAQPTHEFAFKVAKWEADLLALVMQCAYIEHVYGGGAGAAIKWVTEQVEDSDDIPDGEDAAAWWDAHYQPAPTPDVEDIRGKIGDRAANALLRAGYTSTADIAAATDDQLLIIPWFGATSLNRVRQATGQVP